jgi:fatty acid desaturase
MFILPIIEITSLVLAIFIIEKHTIIGILLILNASLFLSFTLHVTVHHFVHFKPKKKWLHQLGSFFFSIILGLPYYLYELQHYNHHRYHNQLEDFTSTWKMKKGKIQSKSFFQYCFLWFLSAKGNENIQKAINDGDTSKGKLKKLKIEVVLILAVYITLAILIPAGLLIYFVNFYLGWCFCAMINYGQHLPIEYGSPKAYTYNGRLYNFLSFNNGLHFEHHLEPRKKPNDLIPFNKNLIKTPFLLAGLFKPKK